MCNRKHISIAIATGQTKSAAIPIDMDRSLTAVQFPAAMTGDALTFEASLDGSTFAPIYNGATLYSVAFAPSRCVALDPKVLGNFSQIKLVSDETELADRTILGVIRSIDS